MQLNLSGEGKGKGQCDLFLFNVKELIRTLTLFKYNIPE